MNSSTSESEMKDEGIKIFIFLGMIMLRGRNTLKKYIKENLKDKSELEALGSPEAIITELQAHYNEYFDFFSDGTPEGLSYADERGMLEIRYDDKVWIYQQAIFVDMGGFFFEHLMDKTELEGLFYVDLDIEAITNELNAKSKEYLNFIKGGTPEGLYYEDYICYGYDWWNVGGNYILYNRRGEWTYE